MRGADDRELSEMGEKEEDDFEAKEDSLSQEAAEAEDEPKDAKLDGAGGWYRREPIMAREALGGRT